ncbi:hypothetical protein D3C75_406260 [compost metagenome]
MSRFILAVITEVVETIEFLLAPYHQSNIKFINVEDEFRNEYETKSKKYIQLEDGRLVSPRDEIFEMAHPDGRGFIYKIPPHLKRVWIPHKEKYASFDEYMVQHVGYYSKDEKTGKWGYWGNPHAKWDYCAIDDTGILVLKSNKHADAAQIKDIFFIEQSELESEHDGPREDIEGVRVPPALSSTCQDFIKDWEKIVSGKDSSRKDLLLEKYGDKQNYLREMLSFSTAAVITPDGTWYEKSGKAWIGKNPDNQKDVKEFHSSYFDAFIRNADPENYLIMVECHI